MALDWPDRTTVDPRELQGDTGFPRSDYRARGPRRWLIVVPLLLVLLVALAVALVLSSKASLEPGSESLASVSLPFTGGTIESVAASGPGGRAIPLVVRGHEIWPGRKLHPGELVDVEAVVRRPGWIGWLAGKTQRLHTQLRTPSASVSQPYLTVAQGQPLEVSFNAPVRVVAYGQPGAIHKHVLAGATNSITVAHDSVAGTLETAAVPRTWETLPHPTIVSWFPPGNKASAVVSPHPGAQITPASRISVSFSLPVAEALGGAMPQLSPATPGRWRELNSHTVVFEPSGYGYGLGTTVSVRLPSGVALIGGQTLSVAAWHIPLGSALREQQLLAQLGYLPLSFSASGAQVARTPSAQETAAVAPPAGTFAWRWGNVPAALRNLWQSDQAIVTKGALMAFENAHEMTTDGIAGPAVWTALIHAAIADERASGGYTFVDVSEPGQSLTLWHDGSVRLTTPVNTGIASAPTELGTFPVYEHISSGTMSGTNPDGSHYNDPGVPWISYFNGGDALHGFERAQYGFPQSLGCVEMPVSTAGQVWPYTPIGTLVHIT